MQKRRLRPLLLLGRPSLLRLLLSCAISTIALAALLSAHHVFPSTKLHLPKQEIGYLRWSNELSWMREFSPPQLSKVPSPSQKT